MFLPLLMEDANSLGGLIYSGVIDFTGGDWILLGIGILVLLAFLVAFARVRSGGVVAIATAFIFVLSILDSRFMFIFWIALIISIFILVNAIRKKIVGQ
jgi:hypothetical protein